jgi:hypothetical protein
MAMTCNVGSADKVVRILLAFAAGCYAIFGGVEGWLRVVLYVVATVLLLTALVGFCPLYRVVGVNSCPTRN